MLRILLQLLSLLAAPLASLAVDAPAPGRVSATEPPTGGVTHLLLDASLLPAATGWFLVPVTFTRDGFVDVAARVEAGPGTSAALIVGRAGDAQALAAHGWGGEAASVTQGGTHVACCADRMEPGGGGARTLARTERFLAGETAWVGLAAVGWRDGSALRVDLTAKEPILEAGAARKGSIVEAFDLADLARRDDENVHLLGRTVLGRPGNASLQRAPSGTGLLALDAVARDGAQARLSVVLPNGTLMWDAPLQQARVGVTALKAGGAFELALREVRTRPDRLDVGDDGVEARVLYADIDVPLEGFAMRVERLG